MIPEAQVSALTQLEATDGFKLVCEKFKRDRDALRDEAMDCDDDAKAAKLRAAWKKLGEFDPEKLRRTACSIARKQCAKG